MTIPGPIDLSQFEDKFHELLLPLYHMAFQAGYNSGVDAHKKHVLHMLDANQLTFNAGEIFSTKIEEIDFTVRTYNFLKRDGVHTVGQLINKTTAYLDEVHNLGQKGIDEIDAKLKEIGLVRSN